MTVRILVVDDSPFICRLLTAKLEKAKDLKVIGAAHDGDEALAKVHALKPDVITLDQTMPNAGGLHVLESVMHELPTPVVMVSGISSRAANLTRQALTLGAVDFVLKYVPGSDIDPEILYRELIAKVRAAAKVKVIRSLRSGESAGKASSIKKRANGNGAAAKKSIALSQANGQSQTREKIGFDQTLALSRGIVVIGASTGGPLALRELLENLPKKFAQPIVIVQHIPATFTDIFAEHLNKYVALNVREALEGDYLEAGTVYVAPGDHHLMFNAQGQIHLQDGPAINGHRPAIDVTMQSAAQRFGSHTRGVILTGMGEDGAVGMVSIRGKGGQTFAQNAESCVVNGMPQRAIDKGGVAVVAEPSEIAKQLIKINKK